MKIKSYPTTKKTNERILAKVEANRKEDPSSEPGSDPNTWLIEARLEEDIPDWESARLHFESPGVEAEIIEVTISEPTRFTVRTRGESPLKKDREAQIKESRQKSK